MNSNTTIKKCPRHCPSHQCRFFPLQGIELGHSIGACQSPTFIKCTEPHRPHRRSRPGFDINTTPFLPPLPTSSRPWKTAIRPYPFSWAAVHRSFTHFCPPNTDSSRLSSTSTWKKLSHCMRAFCRSFSLHVSYYVPCDATPMHSFLNIFFGPP